jgi:hypothetical protein
MSVLALAVVALVAQSPMTSVSGAVVDADTKLQIAHARVLLTPADRPVTETVVVVTDGTGQFSARVPPATYRVFVEHPDYVRHSMSARLTVAAGTRAAPLTIALTRLGVVTGRVVIETGEPARNVVVSAESRLAVIAETRTNDLGEYRLFGLMPGEYLISAQWDRVPRLEPEPLLGLLRTGAFIDPRTLTGEWYPAVFYPGTVDPFKAQPIAVGPGATAAGIDLQLVVAHGALVQN